MLSQACLKFFLVLNTKDDILKNLGNIDHIDFDGGGGSYVSHIGPATVWFSTFF